MVNRNAGAGTRMVIDGLLRGARPEGYSNQPRSHNAVAAAIARGRADWGIAIKPVADSYRLGFTPVAEEHFDFALVSARRERPELPLFSPRSASPGLMRRCDGSASGRQPRRDMRVIGLAGWSGAGKTTLLAKLIPELTGRGLSVSTLKHAHHAFDIDQPGKDSHTHARRARRRC
jgi:hypothetical protein